MNKVTFLEETSVPVVLLGILLETVLACFIDCKRPVSLKATGRCKDVDSGSSSSEISTILDDFPTKVRRGTSSSSDYVVKLASQ